MISRPYSVDFHLLQTKILVLNNKVLSNCERLVLLASRLLWALLPHMLCKVAADFSGWTEDAATYLRSGGNRCTLGPTATYLSSIVDLIW